MNMNVSASMRESLTESISMKMNEHEHKYEYKFDCETEWQNKYDCVSIKMSVNMGLWVSLINKNKKLVF